MLSDFAVYAERILYPHKHSAIVIFIANDITGSENDNPPGKCSGSLKTWLKQYEKNFLILLYSGSGLPQRKDDGMYGLRSKKLTG